jgi:hypothetical protein
VSIFTLNAQPHGSSQPLIVGLAFPLFYSIWRVQEKIRQPNWLRNRVFFRSAEWLQSELQTQLP